MLARLEDIDHHAPRFLAGLDTLRLAVLTHARAEERYEFPRLREDLDEAQRRALTAAVKLAEAAAPTHPRPGVESATRNLMTGPITAVTDRVRDFLRDARH